MNNGSGTATKSPVGRSVESAERWSGELTTRTGFRFHVRPARPEDEQALADFFAHVTPEDLRFRFLTAVREVGHDRLAAMTQIDHERTENFLALDDGGQILATGMLAADPEMERGEVAISIRSDHKLRGISWTLLEHITGYAMHRGQKVIESIESRANEAAIALEREMGFRADPIAGDPTLIHLQKALGGGAAAFAN